MLDPERNASFDSEIEALIEREREEEEEREYSSVAWFVVPEG